MAAKLFRALVMVVMTIVIGADRAAAQSTTPPPIAEFGTLPDAMIFYVAHGAPDACGPGCTDWIAAEGTIQFDTFKRLIAILDRHSGRKLPVIIHTRGQPNLNVAVSLGRIDTALYAFANLTN